VLLVRQRADPLPARRTLAGTMQIRVKFRFDGVVAGFEPWWSGFRSGVVGFEASWSDLVGVVGFGQNRPS